MNSKNSEANCAQEQRLLEEKKAKIREVRKLLEPVPEKLLLYCSDASIARYLRARNWNVKKAAKMLKETLKWRLEYKPEDIKWDEIAQEAETGKIYRSNCFDKHGRSILVMRPGRENSKSNKGKIRYLVYCMENAILNLQSDQEQMVWLIDFCGYNMSHISVKVTKETADVLQNHYPERLGLAILYNPPKFFEPFWQVVKPFLEPKTSRKVKFVYSDNQNSMKLMEDLFNMDELEQAFGGKNEAGFEIKEYAKRMRDDDKKMILYWSQGHNNTFVPAERSAMAEPSSSSLAISEMNSDESRQEGEDKSSSKQMLTNVDGKSIGDKQQVEQLSQEQK
ncbi:random slug protein 5-like [Phalaenopsis equestris]|uniref:random slug protein 5-like n=1 Tax=Phalaenopsis equestris TaxID=78828 RepID=UPI0009E487D0|nr:random slug protein 5-like [Phalaenopsis equestris]